MEQSAVGLIAASPVLRPALQPLRPRRDNFSNGVSLITPDPRVQEYVYEVAPRLGLGLREGSS
jgi:hypothetical protein